ncbi:hypothetical protein [Staphylococcus americanisciuri]|uniref:Phage protein n=1 Tax=Staphylococcus americanisciuri TaxID=2973940 RepID=A0ABT2F1R5_9STAP|nr:hypothetical protein [Staphylococcus americanisciuri]MCS4486398.1 hypothetical protein [Staphylococcus americanisciuri]
MRVRINGDGYLYDLEVPGNRYTLHTLIDEKKWAIEDEIEDSEELESLETEVAKAHAAISAQDVKTLDEIYYDSFAGTLSFETIEYTLKDALEESEYSFEESQASCSLYVINDKGEEVRISDHKRPAHPVNDDYMEHTYAPVEMVDHEYPHEIINPQGEIQRWQLEDAGINLKSEDDVFYLGS